MLFGLFLAIPIKDLKTAFVNVKFAGTSLTINFIWTPLLAWGLGAIFLSNQPALWIGFIMLMVTPCTDWYLVFKEKITYDVIQLNNLLISQLFMTH